MSASAVDADPNKTSMEDEDDANGAYQSDDDSTGQGEGGSVLGKRKRPISVSCELCKQRKVKCDRGKPSCGWCSRNNAFCEYKERKKPGLRAGYGRELEQRLDKLEDVLKTHSAVLQTAFPGMCAGLEGSNSLQAIKDGAFQHSLIPPQGRGGTVAQPFAQSNEYKQPSQPHVQAQVEAITRHEMSQLDELPNPPPSAGSYGERGSVIAPSPVMLRPGSVTASTPGARHHDAHGGMQDGFLQTVSPPSQQVSINNPDNGLPPHDVLYTLVDIYFKHINAWCPILHRKATLDSLFGSSVIDPADQILLHAIVAITLRYSTDPRLDEGTKQHYHDASKQKVLLYGMEDSSVKSLQALVILALDVMGSSNGPPTWNIMALITRSVVQLGLAVEANSASISPKYTSIYTLRAILLAEPRDFVEEESRRRLFWMVYVLDRYSTVPTAFEFSLNDREIDRALPCRDEVWFRNKKAETRWFEPAGGPRDGIMADTTNRHANLGAFSHYIEILAILSEIHNFLKQAVDISAMSDVGKWQIRYKELDNRLFKWKADLPAEYGDMSKMYQPGPPKIVNSAWIMLHATQHLASMRLHSSAAYPTTRSPIFHPSYSASQRCRTAVENIRALSEFVMNNGFLTKLGPPFAFTVWVAARLLLVHGSTVEHKVSPQISFLVDCLGQMGEYWPVAAKYSALLRRVLAEYRDAESHGDSVTPSSVRILQDMRRTAFDLDILINRQHRNVSAVNGDDPAQQGSGVRESAMLKAPGANGNLSAEGATMGRYPSITPARTPQPNEMEYLDVFNFFNVPRLPAGAATELETGLNGQTGESGVVEGSMMGQDATLVGNDGPTDFNIMGFTMDATRDWLFRQDGSTYL